MLRIAILTSKGNFAFICIVLGALVAEFIVLKGTLGISLPSDRSSAVSSFEIKVEGTEPHFLTRNKRFSVVDFVTAHGSRREALVLRESFFMDREPDVDRPPVATVTVEAIEGKKVRWKFQEPGERGDVVTDSLYMVSKPSNGETPWVYTYFSLADGHKVRTAQDVVLSPNELEGLERSIAGGH